MLTQSWKIISLVVQDTEKTPGLRMYTLVFFQLGLLLLETAELRKNILYYPLRAKQTHTPYFIFRVFLFHCLATW